MDLLPIHDFVLSRLSHLEITGSQSYLDLQNVNTHFIIKYPGKSHSLVSPPISSEKPLHIGKLSGLQ